MDQIKKKYSTMSNKKVEVKFPIIIEDKILKLKTKDFLNSLKKILGDLYSVAIQQKSVRAGIGKMRGRKNKKTAGALLVIGNDETIKISGIDVLKSNEISVRDLADNGARLTIFTEKAIKDLEGKIK